MEVSDVGMGQAPIFLDEKIPLPMSTKVVSNFLST